MKKNHIILIVSIVFFIAALALPAVFRQKASEIYGFTCFLMGWMDLYGNGISWLANPVLIFSWIFLLVKKPKIAAFLGLISVGAAVYYLTETEITVYESGSNHNYPISSYGIGYYLWVVSCLTMFIGSLLLMRSEQKSPAV
ncbi:hypothetical protein ACM46_01165 [Chryseobacterium angstadtii]|uniref:Uncharacterized protein n=1 Tax=Chryseobacterium angstadtii TaxID=558151 RepID=A0A0J7IJN7_9FLAO|nr:hypothetical protein [Chryseobacterium angstadtii]KMQ66201.1 hypothetical protein ACM46_01165 [Chryseobacterium angstadtii]